MRQPMHKQDPNAKPSFKDDAEWIPGHLGEPVRKSPGYMNATQRPLSPSQPANHGAA